MRERIYIQNIMPQDEEEAEAPLEEVYIVDVPEEKCNLRKAVLYFTSGGILVGHIMNTYSYFFPDRVHQFFPYISTAFILFSTLLYIYIGYR